MEIVNYRRNQLNKSMKEVYFLCCFAATMKNQFIFVFLVLLCFGALKVISDTSTSNDGFPDIPCFLSLLIGCFAFHMKGLVLV